MVTVQDVECDGATGVQESEETAEFHQIGVTRSGTFVRYNDQGRQVINPNHLVTFNEGQPYQITHPVAGGDSCTTFALAHSVLLEMLRAHDPWVDDHPESPFLRGSLPLGDGDTMLRYHAVRAAIRSPNPDVLQIEERILGFLGVALNLGMSGSVDETETRRDRQRSGDVADSIKVMLAERMPDSLTLSSLADSAHISPFNMCRIFKRETGASIHQYLQHLRLVHTLDRIAERPADRLVDVAIEAGFSSHSHFTAAFRREFGVPPSEARELLKAEHRNEVRKNSIV